MTSRPAVDVGLARRMLKTGRPATGDRWDSLANAIRPAGRRYIEAQPSSARRPRRRPSRCSAQNDMDERVIRELKEDFLAWLTGQVFPEHPTLIWYDAMARRWAAEVVAMRRHRTTKRIVSEAWTSGAGASDARQPPAAPESRARDRMMAANVPAPPPARPSRATLVTTQRSRSMAATASGPGAARRRRATSAGRSEWRRSRRRECRHRPGSSL